MIATRSASMQAIADAVRQAYGQLAFLRVGPCNLRQAVKQNERKLVWTWLKLAEPCPGTFVVVQPNELAQAVARTLLGSSGKEPSESESVDAQCELVNVIAGRALHQLLGNQGKASLGIPRSGRGAPDVCRGEWLGQVLTIDRWWIAIFLQSPDLLGSDEGEANIHVAKDARPLQETRLFTADGVDTASSIWSDLRLIFPEGQPRTSSRMVAVGARTAPALGDSQSAAAPPAGGSQDGDKDSNKTVAWDQAKSPTTVPGNDFVLPKQIGNYLILEKLGEGGMGVVLKAQQTTLNRLVALKLMRPSLSMDEQYVVRFMREARIAAALEHPNIVSIYDAAREAGFLYMALRYVDGGDLDSLLRREGPLEERRAISLFSACLKGLDCIAQAGLIHRDIKPGNILLERDGTPRLADLGLARARNPDDGISLGSAPVGTPSYMSPEQVKGVKDLDIRSDIYSLGMTLYVSITGKNPFIGDNVYETVGKVLSEEAPDPTSFNPNLSYSLSRSVLKALRKDRNLRYQTPQEFHADLQTVASELQREASSMGQTWFGKIFTLTPKSPPNKS